MNSFYDEAGARIRELREINRYTREEFAELAEISAKFLYEIETGKKGFSADTLYRLAKALSVNCEYILSGENSNMLGEDILKTLCMFTGTQLNLLSKILKLMYELNSNNTKTIENH